jgi:hypothetical protein
MLAGTRAVRDRERSTRRYLDVGVTFASCEYVHVEMEAWEEREQEAANEVAGNI